MMAQAKGQRQWTIEVTEREGAQGVVRSGTKCMVALAIARRIEDAKHIMVDMQTIRFTRASTGERLVFLTPDRVAQYIVDFDAGDPIDPFRFRLGGPIRVRRRLSVPELPALEQSGVRSASTVNDQREPRGSRVESASRRGADSTPAPRPKTASDRGGRKPPPTTWKGGRRYYGHRGLRINQDRFRDEASTPTG